ncbi:hypothetical protein NPIL_518771 [Nephila pilipes]|uniref:Uncharacterized protein n=1 Tax=Nephila pilipes TaxID=299642 RepID=A0A8X6P8J2_NEPPI|nr:hypothetical protein NPIL_518771 [Nephila pilipes]
MILLYHSRRKRAKATAESARDGKTTPNGVKEQTSRQAAGAGKARPKAGGSNTDETSKEQQAQTNSTAAHQTRQQTKQQHRRDEQATAGTDELDGSTPGSPFLQ